MKKLLLVLMVLLGNTTCTANIVQKADLIALIIQSANLVKVPSELLIAICMTESSLNSHITRVQDGGTISYGLCQVKLESAQYMDKVYKHHHKVTSTDLLNPAFNSFYAAKILQWNLRRYKGNWQKAVDAYNRGFAASTSSQYVKRVVINMHKRKEYERAH